MGIDINQLPQKAQQQILRKLQVQEAQRQKQVKQSKYHNEKTEADGIKFDSKREAKRYQELIAMLRAGEISGLQLQREFTLQEGFKNLQGKKVRAIRYIADFVYYDSNGAMVVEDAKGVRTDIYIMKAKMMAEKYGITIREI